MTKNRTRFIAGLGAAAGAMLAVFGMRSIKRSMEQRDHDRRHQERVLRRMQGGRAGVGMGNAPVSRSGSRSVGSYQPVDQPDRETIPATGEMVMTASRLAGDVAEMEAPMPESFPIPIEQMAAPMAGHLLGFHSLIEVLRERRRESGNYNDRSLTADDRRRFSEMLDTLSRDLPEVDEGDLPEGSLRARVYRLTQKVREAMENFEYNDDDLFRINGEVRVEVCQVMADLPLLDGGDYDEVRRVYECP